MGIKCCLALKIRSSGLPHFNNLFPHANLNLSIVSWVRTRGYISAIDITFYRSSSQDLIAEGGTCEADSTIALQFGGATTMFLTLIISVT